MRRRNSRRSPSKPPTPPSWEAILGEVSDLPEDLGRAAKVPRRTETVKDRIYPYVLAYYRQHKKTPSSMQIASELGIPYGTVRPTLCDLRASGKLIHKSRGVDIPVDCQ